MSRSIEERVVEMSFDGNKFQQGAQLALQTLKALNKGLEMADATRGLDELEKRSANFSLDGIAESLDYIAGKVSFAGRMFDQFFMNISNQALSTGKQLIASLTTDQISAGWDKYNDKVASVQTIMNATGKSIDEVNEMLDQLMWFSDETSYGFTDMAAALGQMASSGGDVEKLIPLIMGAANATAFAGKGAAEFSRVIYNLNQAYAKGYFGLEDWGSLETAGAASAQLKQALIDSAVELGVIQEGAVDLANFSITLADKWADSAVIEHAFGKFSEASQEAYKLVQSGQFETASEAYEYLSTQMDGFAIKAARSAQEAKTFGEAIGSAQDAVSTGWMNTYEILFGNYEEAKALWTDLANELWDKFASGGEARNEMLAEFKELGGMDSVLRSFWNIWDGIWMVIDDVKQAFATIFPPVSAQQLADAASKFSDLAEHMIYGVDTSERLQRIFKGLFAVVDIGITILKKLGSILLKGLGYLAPYSDQVFEAAANFGDFLVSLRDSIKTMTLFEMAVEFLVGTFNWSRDKIMTAANDITQSISNFVNAVQEKLSFLSKKEKDPNTGLEGVINKFEEQAGWLADLKDRIPAAIQRVQDAVLGAIDKLKIMIDNSVNNFTLNSLMDLGVSGIFGGVLVAIWKFISNLNQFPKEINGLVKKVSGVFDTFTGIFKNLEKHLHGVLDKMTGVLDGVRKSLEAWQQSLQAQTLLTIAKAIAILVGSILVLSLIPVEQLGVSMAAITGLFGEVGAMLVVFSKTLGNFDTGKLFVMGKGMQFFSVAMLILSVAVKNLASLNWEELATGLTGVGVLIIELGGAMAIFSMDTMKADIGKISRQLIIFGVAMLVLTQSVKALGKMDLEELLKGLIGIGVLVIELSAVISTMGNKTGKGLKVGILIGLSIALLTLSKAVAIFGDMDPLAMLQGLAGVAAVFVTIIGFMAAMQKMKKMTTTAIDLLAIAGAVWIFGTAVEKFGGMDWKVMGSGIIALAATIGVLAIGLRALPKNMLVTALELAGVAEAFKWLIKPTMTLSTLNWTQVGTGIVGLAGSLLIAAGAMRLFPKASQMAGLDAGLLGFAVAMTIFVGAFNKIKVDSWEKLAMQLAVLGGSLIIMAGAMKLMSGGLQGAAAMIVMAGAIAILTPALLALSLIPIPGIIVALAGLAGVFAVIGIAAAVLTPLIIPILGLAGAITLLGIACASIGVGIAAFATGLTSLVAIGAGSIGTISTILLGVINLIPFAIQKVAEGIILFAQTISSNSVVVVNAVADTITSILIAIGTKVPLIVTTVSQLMIAFLGTVAMYLPTIMELGMRIIISFLTGIANNIKQITIASTNIIINFINGIADRLPAIIDAGFNLLLGFIVGIRQAVEQHTETIVVEAFKMGTALCTGLIKGITAGVGNTVNTFLDLGKGMLKTFRDFFGIHSPSTKTAEDGQHIDEGLKQGIDDYSDLPIGSMGVLGEALDDKFGQYASLIPEDATQMMSQISTNITDGGQFSVDALGLTGDNMYAEWTESTGGIPANAEDLMSELYGTVDSASPEISSAMGLLGNDVSNTVDTTLSDTLAGANEYVPKFRDTASDQMVAMANGYKSQQHNVRTTALSIIQSVVREIANQKPNFSTQGSQLIDALTNGIRSRNDDPPYEARSITRETLRVMAAYEDDFYDVGQDIVDGFVSGMRSKIAAAARAAAAIARAAYEAAMEEVDAHSPSRKFYQLGQWVDEGFANGIRDYSQFATIQSARMGKDVLDEFSSAITGIAALVESDLDTEPVIRPVFDLDEVYKAQEAINEVVNPWQNPIRFDRPIKIASAIGADLQLTKDASAIQNGSGTGEQTFNFTQNNYSPRELSRLEIYRQTRNQFNQFREAVKV